MTSYAAGGVQQKPTIFITREAKRDLSSYQYHAMRIDTDNYVDYVDTSAATTNAGICMGILHVTGSTAGDAAQICCGGTSLLMVDGNGTNINEGDYLGSNANFHGTKVTSAGTEYFAIAMEPSTADGDLIEVQWVGAQII